MSEVFWGAWVYSCPLPVGMTGLLVCIGGSGSDNPNARWPDISPLMQLPWEKMCLPSINKWLTATITPRELVGAQQIIDTANLKNVTWNLDFAKSVTNLPKTQKEVFRDGKKIE